MSDELHGVTLTRRVLAEHRRVILPLAALLVVNVLVYAAGVYPLAQRVANIEERDRAAEQGLAQARREHDAARGALTGKERATVELATFYTDVLPTDLPGARRLTYLRLAQLAREAGLKLKTSTMGPRSERASTLERLQIAIALEGSYDAVRAFLYQLDTAPEFVVIDDVSLADQVGDQNALQLSMQLSTYYSKAPAR
ncbi:MAG: type 4a pilus biogenesis protein PilO [Vicinamibacterales bacterium]